MNREIKFRVWDNSNYMSSPFTLQDIQNDRIKFTSECTVMQYTGLQDSTGRDIYEGDIIQIPDDYDNYGFMAGEKREIYFLDACFRLKPIDSQNGRGHTIDYGMDKCEVIGNIHENPELIEQ